MPSPVISGVDLTAVMGLVIEEMVERGLEVLPRSVSGVDRPPCSVNLPDRAAASSPSTKLMIRVSSGVAGRRGAQSKAGRS